MSFTCGPHEILTASLIKDKIKVGREATIFILPEITNPGIACGVFSADGAGSVSGCVVGDDQLKVAKGLRQQGFYRFPNKTLSIVGRHSNAYFGDIAHRIKCFHADSRAIFDEDKGLNMRGMYRRS